MRLVVRPIVLWPGEHTAHRTRSPFSATWSATVDLLTREAAHLGASEVVVQAAVEEADLRNDGWLRASARPAHPGVIVSVEGREGPLSFPCDRFTYWQSNVRAVALGMEALRKVDRYGITKRGEQYQGWKALGSGTPMAAVQMSADEALEFLRFAAGWDAGPDHDDPEMIHRAYRAGAKHLHPDAGGDPARFRRLGEARDLLLGATP